MGEIARTYLYRHRDGELIVIREFSFLENVSRLLIRRFKREVHFEIRKTSFKKSLFFPTNVSSAPIRVARSMVSAISKREPP